MLALSRSLVLATCSGDFGGAKVIKKFGDVPNGLSAL